MRVKTAGTIVMEYKDHVLGVDRKECAVLWGQDGNRVMGVTEHLEEVHLMCAPWNRVRYIHLQLVLFLCPYTLNTYVQIMLFYLRQRPKETE